MLFVLLTTTYAAAAGVWPPPKRISLSGTPLALAPDFHASYTTSADGLGTARFQRAISRFNDVVAPLRTAEARLAAVAESKTVLLRLEVEVADPSGDLGVATDYSYTLSVAQESRAMVNASSIYGAMYALESFTQLVDLERGMVSASSVEIEDAPDYPWRGLLVDPGRRFTPVATLENIIDTMAAVKMNVLHLHVSDFCRFGVESRLYPNLTAGLASGPNAGFYTQDDIRSLIKYAGDRGVRVVPEFETPGHALGFLPIASPGGIEFCDTCAYGPTGNGTHDTCKPSQLFGSEGTARVVKEVLGEMADLFTDEVFHIGADETFVKPGAGERCTDNATVYLEKELIDAVQSKFNKTPAGWEQVLFKTKVATSETIVYAYISTASAVTSAGRKAVVANGTSLYFTVAAPGGPDGWDKLWYDIGFDVPVGQRDLLLGGEMSMWADTYCSPRECGAMPAYHTEKGGELYNRTRDPEFGRSLGGMIWPRGYVGAAAFWNFNATVDARSPVFVDRIWTLNDGLAKRGSLVCPSNCSCDQMTACGKPYIE